MTQPNDTPNLAPNDTDDMGSAGRSLRDALRLSFFVLQAAIVVLIVVFLLNGLFTVRPNTVAVKVRLGAIVAAGEAGDVVLRPGAYFALPSPIEQVVVIPTTTQSAELRSDFWYNINPQDASRTYDQLEPTPTLDPVADGYVLTADENLVHLRATVSYRVDPQRAGDVERFVRNVAVTEPGQDVMSRATRLVQVAAARAVVQTVSGLTFDDVLSGSTAAMTDQIRALTQTALDRMQTGLVVDQVLITERRPPVAVREAFNRVTQAETQRGQAIQTARTTATSQLTSTAGPAYQALLEAIAQYEAARVAEDEAGVEAADQAITQLLQGETAANALAALPQPVDPSLLDDAVVGGEVSRRLQLANTYRTQVQQQAQSSAENFQRWLPQYQASPQLVRQKLWTERWREVLSQVREKVQIPSQGAFELVIGPDEEAARQREVAGYQQGGRSNPAQQRNMTRLPSETVNPSGGVRASTPARN